jgi:hypothetical protein
MQAGNHHHMAATNQGLRQFTGRFFSAADNMGRIE